MVFSASSGIWHLKEKIKLTRIKHGWEKSRHVFYLGIVKRLLLAKIKECKIDWYISKKVGSAFL